MEIVPGLQHWKWTGDDLWRLTEAGFLPEALRVELIDGIIIEVPKHTSRHAAMVGRVHHLLMNLNLEQFHLRQNSPLDLLPHFQTSPDVFAVRGHTLHYVDRFPQANDVPLVIEVAETSLDYDRGKKRQVYGAAGIPEYWIVNLRDDEVEVYQRGEGENYAGPELFQRGTSVPLPIQAGVTIPAADLLGPARAE